MPSVGEMFSYLIAALALILNFLGKQREGRTDAVAQGKWQGTVDEQLRQIKDTSVETAKKVGDLASIPTKLDGLEKRIGSLEDSFKDHCQNERGEF